MRYAHEGQSAEGRTIQQRRLWRTIAQAQDGTVGAESIPAISSARQPLIERLVVVCRALGGQRDPMQIYPSQRTLRGIRVVAGVRIVAVGFVVEGRRGLTMPRATRGEVMMLMQIAEASRRRESREKQPANVRRDCDEG